MPNPKDILRLNIWVVSSFFRLELLPEKFLGDTEIFIILIRLDNKSSLQIVEEFCKILSRKEIMLIKIKTDQPKLRSTDLREFLKKMEIQYNTRIIREFEIRNITKEEVISLFSKIFEFLSKDIPLKTDSSLVTKSIKLSELSHYGDSENRCCK